MIMNIIVETKSADVNATDAPEAYIASMLELVHQLKSRIKILDSHRKIADIVSKNDFCERRNTDFTPHVCVLSVYAPDHSDVHDEGNKFEGSNCYPDERIIYHFIIRLVISRMEISGIVVQDRKDH